MSAGNNAETFNNMLNQYYMTQQQFMEHNMSQQGLRPPTPQELQETYDHRIEQIIEKVNKQTTRRARAQTLQDFSLEESNPDHISRSIWLYEQPIKSLSPWDQTQTRVHQALKVGDLFHELKKQKGDHIWSLSRIGYEPNPGEDWLTLFREPIYIGESTLSDAEIVTKAEEIRMREIFYSLLSFNCQNFVDELRKELTGEVTTPRPPPIHALYRVFPRLAGIALWLSKARLTAQAFLSGDVDIEELMKVTARGYRSYESRLAKRFVPS